RSSTRRKSTATRRTRRSSDRLRSSGRVPAAARASFAQSPGRALVLVDQPVLEQPPPREARVAAPPVADRAFAEAVAPRVHVVERLLAAEARQLVGEQDLQIADRALLVRVTAGIGRERIAPHAVHADVMPELVEQRMRGRIGAGIDPAALEAGFRRAPVRARNRLPERHVDELDAVAGEQLANRAGIERTERRDGDGSEHGGQESVRGALGRKASIRRITRRARSSASASRSTRASAALPSTSDSLHAYTRVATSDCGSSSRWSPASSANVTW